MNARSLSNKISHLHLFLSTFDPDLVLVTETWLSSKMNNSEITFNLPYTVFRTDRKLSGIKKCRGGGVCCIAKDTINLYPIAISAVSSCIESDLLCLEGFDFVRSFKFRMILIYRPPKSSVEDDDSLIDTLLDLFLCDLHLIVLGDFNLDINWDLNQGRNSTSVKFLNFFHSFGLKQHVMNPTRCSSVLDIILTSAPIIKNMSLHPPLGTADHNVIGFEICGSFPKPRALPLPNYYGTSFEDLSNHLSIIDWWQVFQGYKSLNDLYERFCRTIYSALSLYVPFKHFEYRPPRYPKHIPT